MVQFGETNITIRPSVLYCYWLRSLRLTLVLVCSWKNTFPYLLSLTHSRNCASPLHFLQDGTVPSVPENIFTSNIVLVDGGFFLDIHCQVSHKWTCVYIEVVRGWTPSVRVPARFCHEISLHRVEFGKWRTFKCPVNNPDLSYFDHHLFLSVETNSWRLSIERWLRSRNRCDTTTDNSILTDTNRRCEGLSMDMINASVSECV